MNRRSFTQALSLALTGLTTTPFVKAEDSLPPVRRLTNGPKFHWFGYYDKWQFDPTGRYVLGCEVDFQHRSPQPDDVIRVGMVDLQNGDKWIELGETRAWNWQQGCMLQFVPGTSTDIIWNDRIKDGNEQRFVAHILNLKTRKRALKLGPEAVRELAEYERGLAAQRLAKRQDTPGGRGQMTRQQKVDYITKNGQAAYLALPW